MQNVYSPARGLSIEDVVDISVLQQIQDTFARAMDVAAVTVDRNGKPITRESNFRPICKMIRSTQEGLARCMKCDADGSMLAYQQGEPQKYLCYGGLMDAASPIIIDGEYLGGILCGQVVYEEEREQFIEGIVERNLPLGLDEAELRQAASIVPAIPRARLEAALEMLYIIANHVTEIGVANVTKSKLISEAEEKARLQEALQRAQLRALEAQVNPHFLFNALTLVGYTALAEDAPQTEEIAYNLSDLLRYSLRNVAKFVPLSEELGMIKRYLAIQKLRFGPRLEAEVELDPAVGGMYIPCMILQPLVENAVVHSVEPLTRPVRIEVSASVTDNMLELVVADDGVGIDSEYVETLHNGDYPRHNGRTAIGLQSVLRRLKGEYGPDFTFEIKGTPGKGTRILLRIPSIEENKALPD
jgi:LytS/YehU family sensor histidine kinase